MGILAKSLIQTKNGIRCRGLDGIEKRLLLLGSGVHEFKEPALSPKNGIVKTAGVPLTKQSSKSDNHGIADYLVL